MAIHWQIPFKSLNETRYVVNIYDDDYAGDPVTLKGAEVPFETEESTDDDAFLPIRTSSGYIRIVVDSISDVDAIMAKTLTDRYVTLTEGETVRWHGYIQPETYSESYDAGPITVDIPVNSVLSVLASISYDGIRNEYRTIYELIYDVLSTVNAVWGNLYICSFDCYELACKVNDGVFEMSSDEEVRHYYGYDGDLVPDSELLKCTDILSAICTYFGFSLREHNNDLYLTKVYTDRARYCAISDLQDWNTDKMRSASSPFVDLPQTNKSDNKRDFISGRNFINIVSALILPDDMLDTDLTHYDNASATLGAQMNTFWLKYLDNANMKQFVQKKDGTILWSVPDVISDYARSTGVTDSSQYRGANLVRISTDDEWLWLQRKSRANESSEGFVSAIAIWSNSTDPNNPAPSIKCASVTTPYTISSADYPSGMLLKFDGRETKNYTPDESFETLEHWEELKKAINIRIIWHGDDGRELYYYIQGVHCAWITNSNSKVGVAFANGKALAGTFPIEGYDNLYVYCKDGIFISTQDVDGNPVNINGKIEIEFYTNDNRNLFLLKNISLVPRNANPTTIKDSMDLSENHFRAKLDGTHRDSYEVKNTFVSKMCDIQYASNFVYLNNKPLGILTPNRTPPERTLLDSLSRWYNRSIEKIVYSHEYNSGNSPLTTYRANQSNYLPIAYRHKWRDSTTEVTLLKKNTL